MKRIKVFKGGVQTHGADIGDPTVWVAEQIAQEFMGKPERWLTADQLEAEGKSEADAIETRQVEMMGETVTEYKLPAEYTVEVEDLTAEIEAKQARIATLRALVNEVRDFDIDAATTAQLKGYLKKSRQLQVKSLILMKDMLESVE